MEIMQLAQDGAVWGCAFQQEHRSCFLLPVFESSAGTIRAFCSAARPDTLSLGKQLGKNNKEFSLVEKVVVAWPALKIKTVFQSKMPIQADIKEKNASRSGSLISMALCL